MFRGTVKTIHFVGIGGIGMSGIAEVLLTLGFAVTGSDLREGESVRRLRALGATVHIGHTPDNLGTSDVVVRSTAVPTSNVEVAAALDKGIPVIRRAEMLAELMRLKHGIAVAGSHGKTTTTSMLAGVLGAAGLDPTVVIGGKLDSLGGTNARLGAGEYLLAEADESDGTFMHLTPTVSLVTNIDPEHLDHYGDEETLERAFVAFANKVPFYGFAVLCQDHPTVQRLIPEVRRRVVTYGVSRAAEYRASKIRTEGLVTRFACFHHEQELGEVALGMPGRHNVVNAVGAVAVARELEVPFPIIARALNGFTGVQRRFTVRGEAKGVLVVDDYAHHPVEIEATLTAAESGFPERRIIAVFQPHRYTRLESLFAEFCGAFNRADTVLVCPVYRAGETPIEGCDHVAVGEAMRTRGHRGTLVVDSLDEAVSEIVASSRPGDLVVTLGAGDVHKVCAGVLSSLEAQ
ncbi:MAG: UDP-N-acetylmuramate--L-alanine ligase [Myxococcota bacterium]